MTKSLLVLYDENCALCRRCRHWMESQPTYVDVHFLAAGSEAAHEKFGSVPWLGSELVVVDEEWNVWAGPAAFLMCLWATERYRPWSYRLSGRTFAPLAQRFFHLVSTNRSKIAAVVGAGRCADGRCEHVPAAAMATATSTGVAARYEPPVVRCGACGAAVYAHADRCWSCGTMR